MTDENYIIMTDDEEAIYSAAEYEDQGFVINNDSRATWALKVIKYETEETERLLKIADQQIEQLRKKKEEIVGSLERRTGYLKSLLYNYFKTVPTKETKTQQSYKLLDGSLVFKKPSVKIVKPEETKLIEFMENNGYEKLVETKKSAKWADFKKEIQIKDGQVILDDTGEVLDWIVTEEDPGRFEVK